MYLCRVICVNNKLLAGGKCDISVCTADIFKPRDYLVRGKSVFSYCGIILLTRPDYTFSRRATFSPRLRDKMINGTECAQHTRFVFLCNPEAPAEGLHLFNLEREVFMYYNSFRDCDKGLLEYW